MNCSRECRLPCALSIHPRAPFVASSTAPISLLALAITGTNYGGRFFDVGLGMSAVVQDGSFRGNRLGIEWLQPVKDDPNGYQLKRSGTLLFNWGIHL